MAERINKISEDPVIYIIDYSNLKEENMIGLVMKLSDEVKKTSQLIRIISIFNDKSYVTPRFMRSVEAITREMRDLIQGQAVVGLNATKKIILKGYNLMFQQDIRNFETLPEAIEYLKMTSSKN